MVATLNGRQTPPGKKKKYGKLYSPEAKNAGLARYVEISVIAWLHGTFALLFYLAITGNNTYT